MSCDIDEVAIILEQEQGYKPTIAQQASIAWVKKALSGDVNALDKITDRNEGKVTEQVNNTVTMSPAYEPLTGESLRIYNEQVLKYAKKLEGGRQN